MEPNTRDTLNYPDADPGDPEPPRRSVLKFVYPGGSRPLDGYTIKRGIGHGGFGEIYYAVSDAGKEVALKLIRRNLDIELRGIRHCLNLKHPNLLDLYDIRQDGEGDTWVVMEYVAGGCLADVVVARPEGLPMDEVLDWFRGVAAGVAYLHGQGIVHRDLKPGNIFSDQGIVKVGDYGLSKFISCSQRSGQTESVGTVHYMAPEVANGRYGKEIDIYALGIMLYELLTGRVPFEGESVGEVLMKHLTATPDVSVLAEPYRSVVARALEKDPEKRFRSVDEMLAAMSPTSQAVGGVGQVPPAVATATAAAAEARAPADPPVQQGVIEAEAVDEEPILREVRRNYSKLKTSWDEADLPGPAKVVILIAAILVLIAGFQVLWPLALTLLIVYGIYRIVRALMGPGTSSPSRHRPHSAPPPDHAAGPPPPPGQAPRYGPAYAHARKRHQQRKQLRRQHRQARETAAAALVLKPARERFTELIGSMLFGALVAIAMSVVMVVVNGLFYDGGSGYDELTQYVWLVVVSIAGTWAVLIPAKFWEGTRGEAILRRFTMLVMGLGLGALAYGAAELLIVDMPRNPDWEFELIRGFRDSQTGRLMATAHLACFGMLFVLLRWWRQANPLRYARLSLWSLLLITLFAALVAGVWHYPASWLMMAAGAISVSVQLASPWLTAAERAPRPSG